MESMILYSTGCPQCMVLKKKLDAAGIPYELVTDENVMTELGFEFLPVLVERDGNYYNFKEALELIKERTNGN